MFEVVCRLLGLRWSLEQIALTLAALYPKAMSIAVPMRQSMTYDQGREMERHKELAKATGIAYYFCDPHRLWQRGSNENIKGLIRKYLPKGTDLAGYSQEQLDANADEINNRPRKGLAYDLLWRPALSCS
jgi:IS30 family transposase